MATLTLKDLMDPLTKIQAATEETAKTLGAIDLYIQKGGGAMSNVKSTKVKREFINGCGARLFR